MISALPAPRETRERPEGAAVLVFPACSTAVPGGLRDLGGGGSPLPREAVPLPILRRVRREELEEEILALWEG